MIEFSIIIPTYNRHNLLKECLKGLEQLHSPKEKFEVIVVDDGSAVSLQEIVSSFSKSLRISLVTQRNGGPAKARNHGARLAQGKYLAFTDDDCTPEPTWLTKMARHFEQHPRSAVGGRLVNACAKNFFANASQQLLDFVLDYFNVQTKHTPLLVTSNFAVDKNLFLELKGFDETFSAAGGEDREFSERIHSAGYPVFFDPEIAVTHHHLLTLPSFCRQHFNYGVGAYQHHQALAQRRKTYKIQIEPLRFYQQLLLSPFKEKKNFAAVSAAAALLLSQAANAAGFFYARFKNLK